MNQTLWGSNLSFNKFSRGFQCTLRVEKLCPRRINPLKVVPKTSCCPAHNSRRATHNMAPELRRADGAADHELCSRIGEYSSERHRAAHCRGVKGGGGWRQVVLASEPLCILAIPTVGLTFSTETWFSPFTLLEESVTANCSADSSGGHSKVQHHP